MTIDFRPMCFSSQNINIGYIKFMLGKNTNKHMKRERKRERERDR